MALRRIVYFIMLYAILTYNVLYQTHDGMVMLIFFAAASISSAAMMLICGFNLKCGYEHNTVYVRRKNEFEVKYRIKNVAPFPVMSAQMLSGDKKNALTFAVGGRCETFVSKKASMEHCGCYSIEVNKISLYDFFRVFRFKIKNPGVVKIVSLPRLFDVNTGDYIYSMTGIQENEGNTAEKSGSEISSIREYSDGDSIRNIHHKLSSRMSTLMVKEYMSEEDDENVYIFCPAIVKDADRMDNMLELMYNMMYIKLKQKGKVAGYLPADGNDESGERCAISSENELNIFFERLMDGFNRTTMSMYGINGARIFAPDVTEEIVECCARTAGRLIVLYVPDDCRDKLEMISCEVVLVSSGGDMA